MRLVLSRRTSWVNWVAALVITVIPLLPVAALAPKLSTPLRLSVFDTELAEPSGLQQFTAEGHVLGFRPGEMLVTSIDHSLAAEFLKANPVVPTAVAPARGAIAKEPVVPSLFSVSYIGLWDKVDLVVEKTDEGIAKSTYTIAPGGDVSLIRLRYNTTVQMAPDKGLIWSFSTGRIHESSPVAWQVIDGQQVTVQVEFQLLGEREVGFAIRGEYDPAASLFIDPTLTWNTFFGSSSDDDGNAIARDAFGNIYVAGGGASSWGSPVRAFSGGTFDAAVAKLSPNGVVLWNTFLGSTSLDTSWGVDVDSAGNVFVAGFSQASWGEPIRPYAGGNGDAFVAKLDSDGILQWNTFLGSGCNDSDYAYALSLDQVSNVYVGGYSCGSWGFPVESYVSGWNAFVAKLSSSGVLQWNTFLGGTGLHYVRSISVDLLGAIYAEGGSRSTWGVPVNPFTGGDDVFVAKFGSNGERIWNTFLGSVGRDDPAGVVVNDVGEVYVTGTSALNWGSPIIPHTGDGANDAFVAKLTSSGVRQWNTFVGAGGDDYAGGVALDSANNVYTVGGSSATWGAPFSLYAGGSGDGFLAKLNGNGTRRWNAFFGSPVFDSASGITLDAAGNMFLVGHSIAPWGSPVNTHSGNYDVFVTRVIPANPVPTVTSLAPSSATTEGASFALLVSGTGFVEGYSTIRWGGSDRATVVLNGTQLQTNISESDIALPGTVQVRVVNGGPGGGISNEVPFVVLPCYALTLGHSGEGADPIASPPNSVGCHAGRYLAGEVVTLTASPAAGSRLNSWTGTDVDTSLALTNVVTIPNAAHSTSVVYAPGPINDDIDAGTVIFSAPFHVTQSTVGATAAVDDPALPCGAPSRPANVWYRYTPAISGKLYLSTGGSDYDTVLSVWTGTRGSLTNLACNNDHGADTRAWLGVSVTEGTTYYISVAGQNDSSGNLALEAQLLTHGIFAPYVTRP